MKTSYNWLKEHVKDLPKPEKLADLLTMHSFEVESIEKKKDDIVLNLDVLPNRAHDCLSHWGIAQECSALTGSKLEIKPIKLVEDKSLKVKDFVSIENKDNENCPRYTARVVKNIKIKPSPDWLKKKLEALDQNSINNIVDITNYVMLETGQPLHAFDLDKLQEQKIVIRKAKKGEKIITLDGEDCDLDEDILVIADSKDPLALAGVKGGKKAEIDSNTKNIVLESANFSIPSVRKTCRKTGIKTEASLRFEHGLDSNLTEKAINRAAQLINEIAGGDVTVGLIDDYKTKVNPVKIKLDFDKLEKISSVKISKSQAIKYLKSLGFDVSDSLIVTIPTIRQDIKIQEDLIEEIVRLFGYEEIPAQHPFGLLGATKENYTLLITNKIKNVFESLGFNEICNFSFIGEEDIKKTGVDAKDYLELENPLSLDLKYLRKDLLINLLKNIKDNFKKVFSEEKSIKIFEVGEVYRKEKNKVKEEKMIAGLVAVSGEKSKGERFYEIKGAIDALFNKLGITDHWYDDFQATPEWTDDAFWQEGCTAEIKSGDKEIGFLGEINHDVLEKINIKGVVVGFNLDFERVLQLAQEELIYQAPSIYPAAVRDLSVVVNLGDRVVDVMNIMNSVGGELIRDIDLFDIYEGSNVAKDKKSLGFRIVYQSKEKTLRDDEIDKIQNKIIKELEKNQEWQVRK